MRLTCPLCGERDLREFTYRGAAVALARPDPAADTDVWADWLHLRENPAGPTEELWFHGACGAWLRVSRDTVTHAIAAVDLVGGADAD